jgi:hypothetical protein
MIVAGDTISDADAKKNPRLVERGVLEKEPDQRKQRAQTEAEPEGKPEKEESK